MTNIKAFSFNPFQTNTYLVWDDSKEAVIIDAAMYSEEENQRILNFINGNSLKLKANICTHAHVDHIMGNAFIEEEFGLKPMMDESGKVFLENAQEYASSFGLSIPKVIEDTEFIREGNEIKFGNTVLKVISTPGHADGSICLHDEAGKNLFSGDVLFQSGIGRTDLPTGDFETLLRSIKEKLFKLEDDVKVYPGHGDSTSIGEEKMTNPYVE
jgi:glyoxylase-like metal-dependent hydrolase (beta-lactamase superfamily II)